MSVVDTLDDPNDQLYMLNELTLSCLNQHAPLRRVKRTRPRKKIKVKGTKKFFYQKALLSKNSKEVWD